MSKVVKPDYTANAVDAFTHRTAMEEAARCLLCIDAPCSRDCPAGTNPGDFIRSIRFRNAKGAAEIIRSNNPVGASCALVCPYDRLCEEACSRCGIDKPIQIGKLQRYAMEQEKIFDMHTMEVTGDKKAEKIACVGAGPASLACAAKLAQEGYDVTIFEREGKAGGVLTYGIPPSRLPQDIVNQDIESVKNLGVKIVLNTEVKPSDLDAFDAVFLGMGLWKANMPKIDGVDLDGVYGANVYLKKGRDSGGSFDPGKKVVVIGGGDVAVDCAVTAKLLGAEDVRIVYRRTLEEAPANMTEFQYALSLGIGITTNMSPVAVLGKDKVEGVEFEGRKGVLDGSSLHLKATNVVFAIGQSAEDISEVAPVAVNEKGAIKADEFGKTDQAKFFSGGDIVNGGDTVVQAVAEGKTAAESIMEFLKKGAK